MLSIVVSCLKEVDSSAGHEVNEAMLLRNASRPDARPKMLEGLRFAKAIEGVPHDCLHERKDAQRSPPVRFDPVLQIVPEFRLEYGYPGLAIARLIGISPSQVRSLVEGPLPFLAFLRPAERVRAK